MTGLGEPWAALADALLEREVLIARLGEGLLPRDLAGLYVTDDDVEQVLRGLPGLARRAPEAVAEVTEACGPRVHAARCAAEQALAGTDRMARLCRAAGLQPLDVEVLALVAAVEFEPRRQRLVQYLQDDVQLPRPTLGLLARLAGPDPGAPGLDVRAAPSSPLRRAALLDVADGVSWANRQCALPDRVAWYLRGDDGPDPGLPAGAARSPGQPCSASPALLLVHGADRESRLRAVRQRWPGTALLVTAVPDSSQQWAAVVREATVGALVLVLELDSGLDPVGRDVLTRAAALSVALSSSRELPLESVPTRAWSECAVDDGDADALDWATAFPAAVEPTPRLTREQLQLVSAAAAADGGQVAPAVRRLAGGHLDGLAVRLRPRRGWADLVLPPDQQRQLRELAGRHRRRRTVYDEWGFSPLPSTGVVALFAGPSGTGKTLAAEVVAGDLGLDLYKVDLSAVVSKYIGETEKNLERIFTAAAAGDLVLFFDEADALFGKRSEVSDAHDRYANIEVAYLLQRLESYDGLVVLATNLQRNIDAAFTRRISVAVDFTAPEEPQRRAIWERSLPPTAPVADLDLDFLARQFKITGGVISGAVLGAAFRAAEDEGTITMEHVVMSLRREFQKLGRLRTEAEFDRYFTLVARDQDRGADAAPAR